MVVLKRCSPRDERSDSCFTLPGTRRGKDVATKRLAVLGCEVVVGREGGRMERKRIADLFSGCGCHRDALVSPPTMCGT